MSFGLSTTSRLDTGSLGRRSARYGQHQAPSWRGKWRRPLGRPRRPRRRTPKFSLSALMALPVSCPSIPSTRPDGLPSEYSSNMGNRFLRQIASSTQLAIADRHGPVHSPPCIVRRCIVRQLHYKVEVGFVACSQYYQKRSQNGR